MILIYLNCTIGSFISLIYIAEKFPLFLSKDEILVKKTPTSLHEWTSTWGWTPSPRPPEPDPPPCGRHKWMAPKLCSSDNSREIKLLVISLSAWKESRT